MDLLRKLKISSNPEQPMEHEKYGLKLVAATSEPSVDIVAVHGLDGHWRKSWTDEKSGVFWLKDLLPSAVPNARIYSYGYSANTHGSGPVSRQSIDDHAGHLINDLVMERKLTHTTKRPIVFLVHSLGGLVLKSALLHSHIATASHLPEHRSIKISTYGIAFLGTPQQGVKGTDIATTVLNIGSLFVSTNSKYYKAIQRDSEWILKQCRDFLAISSDFVTKCFYETRETPTLMGFHKMIAPQVSAVLPGAVNVESIAMQKNHITMTKFSNKADQDFQILSDHITLMLRDAPQKIDEAWSLELKRLAVGNTSNPSPFVVPFGRNEKFVPRQSIMDALMNFIPRGDVHHRVALVGRGGAGKTALATEYAHIVLELLPCAVFWVHSSSRERFQQGYQEIADTLEIPGRDDPEQNVLQLVETRLKRKESGPWLLILDNADDPKVFFDPESDDPNSGFLKYIPQCAKGTVLITTRYKRAAAVVCEENMIEVPSMTSLESRSMLEKKLGRRVEPSDRYEELLQDLENLPLAIAQAVAFMTYNTVGINEYLQMLRENESSMGKLMSEPYADRQRDKHVPNSVTATLSLSFDQLKREDNKAVEILSFVSVLDRQGIPLSLIRHAFAFDTLDFTKAIGRLKSFYLISPRNDGEFFDMHRLVQTSTRSWLVAASTIKIWQLRAVAVLAETFPCVGSRDRYPGRLPACKKYLPHADAVLNYPTPGRLDLSNIAKILYFTALYLASIGNCTEAERRLQRCADLEIAVLGSDELDTEYLLNVLADLGNVVMNQGRLAESEATHRRTLVVAMKVSGLNQSLVARIYNDLGTVLYKQSKYLEAETSYRKVLGMDLMQLGEDGVEQAGRAMMGLSQTFMSLGRLDDGETLMRQVFQQYGQFYGLQNPETMLALHKLAWLLYFRGKPGETVSILREVLEYREKNFGPDHPSTLKTVELLANAYIDLERIDDAEGLIRRVVETRERILGAEHPDTYLSVGLMADFLRKRGENEKALSMAQQALERSERILGVTHADTLWMVHLVGVIFNDLKRHEEAEMMGRRALKGYKILMGPEHLNSLKSAHSLALALYHQNKLEEAESLGRRVLSGMEKVCGPDDLQSLYGLHNLALTLLNQGKLEEAECMARRALVGMEKHCGPEHPQTLDSIHNLALILSNQGNLEEAESLARRELLGREKLLGPDPSMTIL